MAPIQIADVKLYNSWWLKVKAHQMAGPGRPSLELIELSFKARPMIGPGPTHAHGTSLLKTTDKLIPLGRSLSWENRKGNQYLFRRARVEWLSE